MDSHHRGMLAALNAAARVDLHHECDSELCTAARQRSTEAILRAFDVASGGRTSPIGRRNATAIGILVAHSPRMYGLYPISPVDDRAPRWLRAIMDMPDLRTRLASSDFDQRKIWAPQAVYLAAYMRVQLGLDVRILTCTLRNCLRGAEAFGTVLVHKCQSEDIVSFGNRGELVRDVRWAMLTRLEAEGVRVYPPTRLLWRLTTKWRYYEMLESAGVPTAPFFKWVGPTPAMEVAKAALRTGWPAAIVKPSWSVGRCGGIALGIFKLNFSGLRSEREEDRQALASQLQVPPFVATELRQP